MFVLAEWMDSFKAFFVWIWGLTISGSRQLVVYLFSCILLSVVIFKECSLVVTRPWNISIAASRVIRSSRKTWVWRNVSEFVAFGFADEDIGQKIVSVMLDGREAQLEIVDHPAAEMSVSSMCADPVWEVLCAMLPYLRPVKYLAHLTLAGYAAHMRKLRNAYKPLVGNFEGKRPLGTLWRIWVDNITIYFCWSRVG